VRDLEFRVLGRVEVLRGDVEVTVGRRGMLNLLAALLLSANTVVSADSLAELAWGQDPPRNPRSALHSKIARLRQVLGDRFIETVGEAYRLRADTTQLDLLRFESLVTKSTAANCDEEAAAALDEALALWRGEPLGNVDSPILTGEAAPRLTERFLVVCERWGEVALRLGQTPEVVRRIAPLVDAHPFRESIVRLLMSALYHDDRQADALKVYDLLRHRLRDELGADPSAAVQELHTAILRGIPVGSGSGQPSRTAPRWSGPGPMPGGLVGRDSDATALTGAVRHHPAITVTGPGGVGKTALALEAAANLARESIADVTVAELGTLPAQQAGDPSAVAGVLLAARAMTAAPTEHAEAVLLEALRESSELVVLDNAEHVVTACARLVDLIVRSCPGVRVIITSRRPLGYAGEKVLELAPLSPASAAQLLRLRMADARDVGDAGSTSADDARVTELCRLIEGLPLAVELAAARLRTMSLSELLDRITIRPDLLANAGRPGLPHQYGLTATLRWSYDLLTPSQQLLLGRLGVVAGPFSLQDAERIGGYDPLAEDDVAVLLSGLADNSLVRVIRNDRNFWYRLLVPIREFAVAHGSPVDLDSARARHLRLLCATADRLDRGDDSQRDRIIARLLDGFSEILHALDWALRPGASQGDVEQGVRLLLTTQPVWERRTGGIPIMIAHAIRVLDSSRENIPPALAADLTGLVGYLHFRMGDLPASQPFLERVRSMPGQENPERRKRQALALTLLAGIALARMEPDTADLVREACEAARQSKDPATIAVRLSIAAQILVASGHPEEAAELIEEAGQAAGGVRSLRLVHLGRRAQVRLRTHRVAQALADTEAILSCQDEISVYDRVQALRNRGTAQALNGQPTAALTTLAEALRLARDAQAGPLLPELAEAQGFAALRLGDLSLAIKHVREGLAWTVPNDDIIDSMGMLHLAVVLAVRTRNPLAPRLAALVRDCRLSGGLPTWPFTEAEYARHEQALGVAERPIPAGPFSRERAILAGELVLAQLHTTGTVLDAARARAYAN
jgi:predicted ATPase/DNA-binding SARP family transcriptional activator